MDSEWEIVVLLRRVGKKPRVQNLAGSFKCILRPDFMSPVSGKLEQPSVDRTTEDSAPTEVKVEVTLLPAELQSDDLLGESKDKME